MRAGHRRPLLATCRRHASCSTKWRSTILLLRFGSQAGRRKSWEDDAGTAIWATASSPHPAPPGPVPAPRDLRQMRAAAGPAELAEFETDVLAGFVLARAAAGLSDGTISSDILQLEQVRAWFARPLWEMDPPDADAYFG